MTQKNIVLFVNAMHAHTYDSLRSYEQRYGRHLAPLVIVDTKLQSAIHNLNSQHHLYGKTPIITADFDSPLSIRQALQPYLDRILAVTSQYENSIHELKKIIPHIPYLPAPTETSLDWATDKKLMREAFNSHDDSLSPDHLEVIDASERTVNAIEARLQYPMIIKPSGLERSLLVAVVHDQKELRSTLTYTFQQLSGAYKRLLKRMEPSVLVEEFMSGDMFSIDSYITADGTFNHAPLIKVITGHKVGFEDFFAHLQTTSHGLKQQDVAKAQHAAEQACQALGLRSITAHTELMKTASGWKIIEVGPRIGGYRHELYALSHGIDHIMNDILNRAAIEPQISLATERHAAVYKTYAHTEGTLIDIDGIDTIQALPSYITIKLPYHYGDMLRFARNNGDAPVEITLCHEDVEQLHTDIAEVERLLRIRVQPLPHTNPEPKTGVDRTVQRPIPA